MLTGSDQPLAERYDVIALDLDGVVYIGGEAVPGAPDHLAAARRAGARLAFVTNNASRPTARVADNLRRLGIEVDDDDVVNSAQAAAGLLADRFAPDSPIYLIGGEGLEVALADRGLRAVTSTDEHPVAVVQGYGPDMPWRQVMTGAILVHDGLPWVATNTDLTIPTAHGIGPGNGALVRLVAEFADREPEVAGKPSPPLLEETARRTGAARPLMVGDRLDTDIEGGHNVGWDTLLVMTGVTKLAELVATRTRPTYLGADLGALVRPAREVSAGERVEVGGWVAEVVDGGLQVNGSGKTDSDALSDWWRCVAVAAWSYLDRTGEPCDAAGLQPPSEGQR